MGIRLFIPILLSFVALNARADDLIQVGDPINGRVRFHFTGASMANAAGLSNGLNCLKSSATTTVHADALPAGAELVAATLYISGSLFNDGSDDLDPATADIFDAAGWIWPNDQINIENIARLDADRAVEFTPPGAASPTPVSLDLGFAPYVTAFMAGEGLTAFFTSRIDVTDVIRNAGGVLEGDYTVGDLRADICDGIEVACDDPDNPTSTCFSDSFVHTAATASFGLLLVVEAPSLPLATVITYEGLSLLNAATPVAYALGGGFTISDPAAGELAAYVIEGDALFGGAKPSDKLCKADEYIWVNGTGNPNGGVCLEDAANPLGNIFNSTINTQPVPAGACPGDVLCDEVGVDIDQFDISAGLAPGATSIDVSVVTNADTVALVGLALRVDVFTPIIEGDSQIRLVSPTTEFNEVQLGGPVELSLAVSNLGNIPADGVRILFDGPALTHRLSVLSVPAGAVDNSTSDGGAFGNGFVDISGFSIAPGEATDVRVQFYTTCDALAKPLLPTMQVEATDVTRFTVVGSEIAPRGPGIDACEGAELDGPFNPLGPFSERDLRGGGCATVSAPWFLGLFLIALWRRLEAMR